MADVQTINQLWISAIALGSGLGLIAALFLALRP